MADKPTPRKATVSTGKALAKVVAPELAVPAEVLGNAVSGDLVVIRTRKNVGTKRKPEWREVEYHVNPATGAIAAVGGLFAIGLGWLTWEGFSTIGIPGLKDSPFWAAPVDNFVQRQRLKRDCKAAGGKWDALKGECTYPSGIVEGYPREG